MQNLEGFDTLIRGEVLFLSEDGEYDAKTGIRGWQVDYGTTGFCPIGNGDYYISHPDGGEGGKSTKAVRSNSINGLEILNNRSHCNKRK